MKFVKYYNEQLLKCKISASPFVSFFFLLFLIRRLNFVLIELRRVFDRLLDVIKGKHLVKLLSYVMDGAYTEETLTALNMSKLID